MWQLIDALGDGLALTDHEGRIALVNQRCAEMFGYKREELIGLPVDALVPAEVRAAHHGYRAGYQRAPHTRPMAERSRLAGLRKDGATLPVEISLSPLPTASEHFVLAVIRDVAGTQPRNDLADLARDAAAGAGAYRQRPARPRGAPAVPGRAELADRGQPARRRGTRSASPSRWTG